MSALFAASTTGANLLLEIQAGSHERMLVTPLSRSSLLLGRALKDRAAGGPGLDHRGRRHPLRLPAGAGRAVIGMAMLAVFGVGLGALSYTLALRAVRGLDLLVGPADPHLPAAAPVGMLLPLDDAPGWLQALSKLNPLTHIVDAERALFADDVTETVVLRGALSARDGPGGPHRRHPPCSEPPPGPRFPVLAPDPSFPRRSPVPEP
jgi:ABC-2 type transport system permease protein